MSRRQAILETLLIFAVFCLQGAWPVPEVNEPYYLGKAIHYWNPHWASSDWFLQTADTHAVFYFSVGWLALILKPTAFAWTVRLLTWALLAWSWQRLSRAVVPRAWVVGPYRDPLRLSSPALQHGGRMGRRRGGGQGVLVRAGVPRPGGHGRGLLESDVAPAGRRVGVSYPRRRLGGRGGGSGVDVAKRTVQRPSACAGDSPAADSPQAGRFSRIVLHA